jgi:hypothetical protein
MNDRKTKPLAVETLITSGNRLSLDAIANLGEIHREQTYGPLLLYIHRTRMISWIAISANQPEWQAKSFLETIRTFSFILIVAAVTVGHRYSDANGESHLSLLEADGGPKTPVWTESACVLD